MEATKPIKRSFLEICRLFEKRDCGCIGSCAINVRFTRCESQRKMPKVVKTCAAERQQTALQRTEG